jgi:hypothetical protein
MRTRVSEGSKGTVRVLPSNPLSLHEAYPRAVLGADKGQSPAGHQANRQEEDAAGCVGGALKHG